jgi:hypothetical protein
MPTTLPRVVDWVEANQRVLVAELTRVRGLLDAHLGHADGEGGSHASSMRDMRDTRDRAAEHPALDRRVEAGDEEQDALRTTGTIAFLCTHLGLSPFERDLLLLAAGVELDDGIAARCGRAHGDPRRMYATFGLALAALPGAHWSALAPDAPLRRWSLVRIADGPTLVAAALTIDERILHFLTGVACTDPRLAGLVRSMPPTGDQPTSQRVHVLRLVEAWRRAEGSLPLACLGGEDVTGARVVAACACRELGLHALVLRASDVPAPPFERAQLAMLLTRECLLSASALVIDASDAGPTVTSPSFVSFLEALGCPAILLADGVPPVAPAVLRLDVQRPAASEQEALWSSALPDACPEERDEIGPLAAHFRFGVLELQGIAAAARTAAGDGVTPRAALWRACRMRTRGTLDGLAERIEPRAAWPDLVIPERQMETLSDIARHMRHRQTVYETWGMASAGTRGLGISALFTGESGTGKTLAAEVLAHDLELDLYRIDLAAIVSKYIGETEKNLKRLFDAADAGGAVLLFDEADALFGRRSSVKDSHDRYANIEVAYLLQRMEAYRGVAILTTNMKSLLEPAFLRRIRFVVPFPFPDAASRARIWARMFPEQLPRARLDLDKLARLAITGGHIRNIAVNAAFHAADAHAPLDMGHLLHAARSEYAKLEKPLTDAETGGWS